MKRTKLMRGGQTFIMNLSDVPHGELIGSKDYEDGRHIDFYRTLPGTKVMTYDEVTGQPVWVEASGWSHHTGSKVELVQLSTTDTITTDNDPRAVYGIPSDAKSFTPERDTPTNALKRKFIVPILPTLPVDTPVYKSVNLNDTGGSLSMLQPSPENWIMPADYEFGQFLGLMAGDGWWNKKQYAYRTFDWQFNLSDLEGYNADFIIGWGTRMLRDFKYHSRSYTKDQDPSRYGDTVKWAFICREANVLCKSLSLMLGGSGDENTSGSGNKRLPFWFMSLPRDFRVGLLNGIVATDGSISLNKSGNRSYPELGIQITSTSLTLIEDIKALCSGLGIHSAVSFSKTTTKGNSSWLLTLSSIDCKREGVFDNCCHIRKRDIFKSAKVADDANAVKGDIVPFPAFAGVRVKKYIRTHDNLHKAVVPDCPLARYYAKNRSLYVMADRGVKCGYVTRSFMFSFVNNCSETLRVALWFDSFMKDMYKRLLETGKPLTDEEVNTVREGLVFNADILEKFAIEQVRAALVALKAEKGSVNSIKRLAAVMPEVFLDEDAMLFQPDVDDPVVKDWIGFSMLNIRWAYIKGVDKTNEKLDGYDLTVPGYETFTSASGVVLSNTMTYYVPVSNKAVEEAYRVMMPSKNLLAARDFKSMPEMQEELVSGAWFASHRKNTPPKAVFNTKQEAIQAYMLGKIKADDNVIIKELTK